MIIFWNSQFQTAVVSTLLKMGTFLTNYGKDYSFHKNKKKGSNEMSVKLTEILDFDCKGTT